MISSGDLLNHPSPCGSFQFPSNEKAKELITNHLVDRKFVLDEHD